MEYSGTFKSKEPLNPYFLSCVCSLCYKRRKGMANPPVAIVEQVFAAHLYAHLTGKSKQKTIQKNHKKMVKNHRQTNMDVLKILRESCIVILPATVFFNYSVASKNITGCFFPSK